MKHLILLIFFTQLIHSQDFSQLTRSSSEAMAKLSFMPGEWEGSGWIITREGKQTFTQTEKIELKVGGMALLVEGQGKHDGVVIHDALAIIAYDAQQKNYSFESHLSDGRSARASGVVPAENSFVWTMQNPYAGTIRYTIKLTSDGKWHEIGERSKDGQEWIQFFEMTLNKRSKND